jgi:FG-GAP repeat
MWHADGTSRRPLTLPVSGCCCVEDTEQEEVSGWRPCLRVLQELCSYVADPPKRRRTDDFPGRRSPSSCLRGSSGSPRWGNTDPDVVAGRVGVLVSARREVVELARIVVVLVLVLAFCVWPSGERALAVQAARARSLQADFNNDGAADLAIGVPFEWVGAVQDAGAVHVLYGSAGGLEGPGSQFFTQDTPGVPGTVDQLDHLGFGLATGDFDQDGFADLAIGVPGEDIGMIGSAGAVVALYG